MIAAECGGVAAESPREAIELARGLAGGDEIVVASSIYRMGEIRGHLLGIDAGPPTAM